jgi:hypothetical protein
VCISASGIFVSPLILPQKYASHLLTQRSSSRHNLQVPTVWLHQL